MTPPDSQRLPRRLGPYEVEAVLGQGGMGTVLRARHVELDVVRAVKVFHGGAGRGAVRFAREAGALARIRHPNVVAVHEVGHDDAAGASYFAMDLVAGRSLDVVLADAGRLPLARALDIVGQVARGVAALHAAGIVHRDLKPSNVVIGPEGQAVVIDLGLALAPERDDRLTATGQLVGTPVYMAPEQLGGRGITPRTDVHALGLILIELLTGRVALAGAPHEGVTEAIGRVMSGPRPRPCDLDPELPGAVDALCLRAAAIDPAARFPDAAAFADALDLLRRAPGRSARGVQRRRLVARAALVAAGLGALGLLLVRASRGSPLPGPVVVVAPAPAVERPAPSPPRRAPAQRLSELQEGLPRDAGRPHVPRLLVALPTLGGDGGPTRGVWVHGGRLLTWSQLRGEVRLWAMDRLASPQETLFINDTPLQAVVPVTGGALLSGGGETGALSRLDLSGPTAAVRTRLVGLDWSFLGPIAPLARGRVIVTGLTMWASMTDTLSETFGRLVPPPGPESMRLRGVVATPGLVAVATSDGGAGGLPSGSLRVWRRPALEHAFRTMRAGQTAPLPAPDHVEPAGTAVTALCASPVDPGLLAFGTATGGVTLLRLDPGASLVSLVAEDTADPSEFRAATAHPYEVCGMAFTADGERLVTAARGALPRGELRVWSVPEGRLLARVAHDEPRPDALALSADGRVLAVGTRSSGLVELWAVE